MAYRNSLDKRIEEQNKKKNRPPQNDEPDEMDLELERARMQALNRQKSVFDTDEGNRAGGINTAPSVFEKLTVFHTET